MLVIDGSYGEGGGQILRTALALAAIAGKAVRFEKIRAGRKNPGLAAQHLTVVRAIATLCNAQVSGDEPGSQTLIFRPGGPVQAGDYVFDVAEAREGGSAGAATLVLQAILLPLSLAGLQRSQGQKRDSTVTIRGGTHVAWSPPFDYVQDVWLPALSRLGVDATLELNRWGWYPVGQGEIQATIRGLQSNLSPLTLVERGALLRVRGRAVAANLPSHIPQRMATRAQSLLKSAGIEARVDPLRVRAACAGAGIFLTAEYETVRAGFSALGARGKASEVVAEEAVAALLAHRDSGAVLDQHLADQLVLPLALAGGVSSFSVERVSRHLTTNIWVVEQFGLARASVAGNRVELRSGGGGSPGETR
ncbi:MAG: RNA 3'-terminal phosphate cyclase [Anaerolineae bacterium]